MLQIRALSEFKLCLKLDIRPYRGFIRYLFCCCASAVVCKPIAEIDLKLHVQVGHRLKQRLCILIYAVIVNHF